MAGRSFSAGGGSGGGRFSKSLDAIFSFCEYNSSLKFSWILSSVFSECWFLYYRELSSVKISDSSEKESKSVFSLIKGSLLNS